MSQNNTQKTIQRFLYCQVLFDKFSPLRTRWLFRQHMQREREKHSQHQSVQFLVARHIYVKAPALVFGRACNSRLSPFLSVSSLSWT